jgi:maltose-binding protein MalE
VGDLTPNKKPLPDLGYFPFPATSDGKGDPSAMMQGADGYSCSAWAPKECSDFLNFLATTDQETKYATAFQTIPANKAAQASVTDPATKAALEASNNAKYSVLFLDTLFGSNIGNALNSAVVNFMSGKTSDPQSIIDAVNNASSKG